MKLEEFKNLVFGTSHKKDGKMNFNDKNFRDLIFSNRKKFLDSLGINIENIVSTRSVHGNNIYIADIKDKGTSLKGTDGLITDKKDLFLTATVSDCVPIYFYDYRKKIIGLAHAGWRGVINGMSKEVINKMIQNFDTNTNDIIVFVGPHIQKCHFEIKDDIIKNFKDYKEYIIENKKIKLVDLSGIIKKQLLEVGVDEKNITITKECTYCNDKKFTSFRRDKPEKPNSMIAYIGMR